MMRARGRSRGVLQSEVRGPDGRRPVGQRLRPPPNTVVAARGHDGFLLRPDVVRRQLNLALWAPPTDRFQY